MLIVANASAIFGAGSSGTSGNSTGGFNFGNGGSATPQGFQFGTPNNTNHNSTPSGGFNFGAGTAAGAAGAHPFVFAGAANNTGNPPASKFTDDVNVDEE